MIDGFLAKVEELVDRSKGKIRADVVHRKLTAMGYVGSERTTRRAVSAAKAAWRAGRRRLPAVDTGAGDVAAVGLGRGPAGRRAADAVVLRWLAWSRFRVVIPAWDQGLGTLTACLDRALRIIGGAPTYLLTDNAKDGDDRACGRDTGPPPGHGGAGPALRLQGGDVQAIRPGVQGRDRSHGEDRQGGPGAGRGEPAPEYASFGELEAACRAWCERVNARIHRETAAAPAQRLAAERAHLHLLPAEPYVLALGEERLVNDDQTIRFGSVRYSTPPGHVGDRVWCRVHGTELVIVARIGTGVAEIARHRLSTPGSPRIPTSITRIIRAGTGRGSPGHGPAPARSRRSWSWARARGGG